VVGAEEPYRVAEEAAEALRERIGGAPDVAIVMGSGWAAAEAAVGPVEQEVAPADLPGFAPPTAPGHQGTVRSVRVGTRLVLVLSGRVHLYEGHPPSRVVHAVRVAVLAGAGTVVLTNAAGSLRPDLRVGRPVLIADHLNLTGRSPLTGPLPPQPRAGPFLDVTHLYHQGLRALVRRVDPSVAEAVYAGVPGPQFETPAEIRALRAAGADLVGMSTVLEAIAAHHLGARVLGLSLVTNLAAGLTPSPIDGEEVLREGAAAAGRVGRLLAEVVRRLDEADPRAGPG